MKNNLIFSQTKKDFKFDWFNGSGNGGQNRQKNENCLRLTHIPTNITVVAQSQRTRKQNQKDAFEKIVKLIEPWLIEQSKKILNLSDIKRQEEYEEVRVYHDADNYVKDHASNHKISFTELDKKFDELIVKRKHGLQDRK